MNQTSFESGSKLKQRLQIANLNRYHGSKPGSVIFVESRKKLADSLML